MTVVVTGSAPGHCPSRVTIAPTGVPTATGRQPDHAEHHCRRQDERRRHRQHESDREQRPHEDVPSCSPGVADAVDRVVLGGHGLGRRCLVLQLNGQRRSVDAVVEVALAGQQLFESDGPFADHPFDLDDVLELGGIDEQILEAGDHITFHTDADVEIDELIGDVGGVLGATRQATDGRSEIGDQWFEIGGRHLDDEEARTRRRCRRLVRRRC